MPGREKLRITFPKLDGYRLEVADEELWLPDELEPFTIGPGTVPSWTQSAPVVGEPDAVGEHRIDARGGRLQSGHAHHVGHRPTRADRPPAGLPACRNALVCPSTHT